jgi:hypothetical protein
MSESCTVAGCRFVADYNVVTPKDESRTFCGIHWVAWTVKNADIIQHCTIKKLWVK